jgi:hypothetical protein
MCLYVATILGDQLEDIVVVGGLVPYLIVEQESAEEPHVGTGDLDLGFSIGVLSEEKYRELSSRLRAPEALVAVRDAAFADPGVWRFQAYHDVENLGSGRVMEKAGLCLEGILRRYSVHPQVSAEPRDCAMRAVVRGQR